MVLRKLYERCMLFIDCIRYICRGVLHTPCPLPLLPPFNLQMQTPQPTATTSQIGTIQGVCNTPLRRRNFLINNCSCVLCLCYICHICCHKNRTANRLPKRVVIFPQTPKNSPEPVAAPARSSQQLYYKVMFGVMLPWRSPEFPLP